MKALAFIKCSEGSYINRCHSRKQMTYTNWNNLRKFEQGTIYKEIMVNNKLVPHTGQEPPRPKVASNWKKRHRDWCKEDCVKVTVIFR